MSSIPTEIFNAVEEHQVDVKELGFKPNRNDSKKGTLVSPNGKHFTMFLFPVVVTGGDIYGSMNGKRFFQFKLISEDDEWYQSLEDDLKKKCGQVCTSLKTMSNTLLGLCYKHNVANPNKLGQAKFVHEANLAWETKWNMTAGHRNTTYGGDAPAEPIRFWTQNAAGKFKQISLPNESLEGSIVRMVISKFILYRRQSEYGVMLELGKDVMVLKKGGVKIRKILNFPSMNIMNCDETTKDGILNTEQEHADNRSNTISLLDESAAIEDVEDVENDEDDDDDDDEEEYMPPAKKQKTTFVTPRRKTRSSTTQNSP
jgi:hypothetical protein